MNKKLFFVDVETTGTNPAIHGIWQLAYIIEINGKIKYKENLFMQPAKGIEIDEAALLHCGISKKHLKTLPDQKKQFQKFLKVLEEVVDRYDSSDKMQVVAYNAHFDVNFIRSWFKRDNNYSWYDTHFFSDNKDTMVLASEVCQNIRHRMKNFKLETVCSLFKVKLKEAHNAVYDNKANYKLYHKLTNYIKPIKDG